MTENRTFKSRARSSVGAVGLMQVYGKVWVPSLGKLFGSVIAWKVRGMALEFAGPGSVAWDPDDETGGDRQRTVLNSFQSGIAGGTDEIQRNIIGDSLLGRAAR